MRKKYHLCNCDEIVKYDLYLNIDRGFHKESNCEKEHKDCTAVKRYTDWKEHIIQNFCKKDPECHLLLHCLKRKITFYKKFEEGFKTVIIPIYLAMLTVIQAFILDKGNLISMVVIFAVFFIIAILCSIIISNSKDKILFYEECIVIIENAKSCHQKTVAGIDGADQSVHLKDEK